jgi:uncharacterized membrane protein YphA (DoxX/SURF4 family)
MSKTKRLFLWIAIGFGVLAYASAGTAKVVGVEQMAQSFTHFHLPLWFMTFIGLCELAGAVGLLIRPLSAWAALGLAIIMVGAVVMHLIHDDVVTGLPAMVLLILMTYVAWQRRTDALWIFKTPAATTV